MDLTAVITLAIIFGFIYAIVHLGVRRKERMALINSGADPSIFQQSKPGLAGIRYGLLLIGVAIGILLGNILEVTTSLDEEVAYFSMIFLLGGLALVISYFVERDQRSKED